MRSRYFQKIPNGLNNSKWLFSGRKKLNVLYTIILLMYVAILLVGLSQKIRLPYPIALVIGGAAIGFIPGLSPIEFDPKLLLVIVLPPILFYASYNISFKEFIKYSSEIFSLAIGLVIVTTVVISCLFKWLFPHLPWSLAIAFGAIVSPPDAVAATAVLRRFSLSSRLITILEGESLINDASALIIYRFAVIGLFSTQAFSFHELTLQILQVTFGGIGIGLICGYLFNKISSYLIPVLSVACSFVIPYATYSVADYLEASGVLAVVACGLVGARLLVTQSAPLTRVLAWASWDILVILLNCFIFILIGLEFRHVITQISPHQFWTYFVYGLLIIGALIGTRIIWIYLRRGWWHFRVRHNPNLKKLSKTYMKHAVISSWAGMRGIVSMTAALALPLNLADGTILVGRDIVIFLTFQVIFFTLVLPGLTLPFLVKWLHIQPVVSQEKLLEARKSLARAAHAEIERLFEQRQVNLMEKELLISYFSSRHQIMESYSISEEHQMEQARHRILQKQRAHLMELWIDDEISDHLMSELEREIDIEEIHLVRGIL